MYEFDSLYIERNECVNCCRCVRECEVKAIAAPGGQPDIDHHLCVHCSACVKSCKQKAIKLRDDIYLARQIIKRQAIKIASVSPQWRLEFDSIDEYRFVEALSLLGFTHICESSAAGDRILQSEIETAKLRGGINISSRCPAVVEYIMKHKPQLAENLLPLTTPMSAHARELKQTYGPDAAVIHISSCVAAKNEAVYDNSVNTVITFAGLKRWLKSEGIDFDKISGAGSYLFGEPCGNVDYLTTGNIARQTDVTVVSGCGMDDLRTLTEVSVTDCGKTVYLDILACRDGCISGGGSTLDIKIHGANKFKIQGLAGIDKTIGSFTGNFDNIRKEYRPDPVKLFVSEGDTVRALDELGISIPAHQTDCNGCGYGTCRRFAKALSRREVGKELCVYYLRTEVPAKFSALISRISSGVAIIGANMRIEEANRILVRMIGPEAEFIYENNPGLKGVNAADVLPFAPLISSVLENGDETIVRDIQVKERILTVSIHTVQRYKTVMVICRNMLFSQVRNEEIVARTQKVIDENLSTVQKIAFLLGENASRTEAILNSILKAQSDRNGQG